MAFFEETGDEFITDVRKFETTDKAHADLFNNVCGNLYNNDVYLRKNKVDKIEGKGLSTNDYTNSDKDKLAGIEERANKYVHPETHTADIITQDTTHRFVTDTEKETWNNSLNNAKDYADATYQQATGYTDNKIAELINGAPETLDTLKEVADAIEENESVVEALDAAIGKKANQAELDTHINNSVIHVTATDKSNWNSAKTHAASAHAPANAEVNQNAFSNVAVGNTTIAADSKTDTLTFAAGRNITLTPDANNDKITVSLTDKCTTITDWNLATANGWYMGRGADNSPSELVDWWYGLVIAYSTMYVRQILYRFATDNNVSGNNSDRYERIMQNGVWGTWVNTSVKVAVPKNAKFTDTTYSNMTGATASAAGKAGLVPAPAAGAQTKFLRGDGTWQVPTNTTYSAAGTSLGLVKTGGDVTISNGTITVNDDSHNHTIANIDNLQATLNGKAASSHTHNYIPLSGSSTITGNLISSTDAQKNLGDRTHVWNEVWAKSVKVKGNYGDDETYGIAYNNGDNKTGLIIGNLDDIEGGSNSQWVVVTDDCRMCNSLEVEGSITGTGVTNLMKRIYPVGSIYISTVSTNPSTLFGFGTWAQIKDTFLLAAGTTYKAGSTGGEATHKLTVNEMPAHTHQQSVGQSSEDFIVAQGGEASWVLNGAGTSQTGSTGGSAAHNNMPPYLAVYVWKRTA